MLTENFHPKRVDDAAAALMPCVKGTLHRHKMPQAGVLPSQHDSSGRTSP